MSKPIKTPIQSEGLDIPARQYAPVVKANTVLPDGPCRALLVGSPGTANLMDWGGEIREGVPLQVGYNPICCLQVREGGTADNIWALY